VILSRGGMIDIIIIIIFENIFYLKNIKIIKFL
jgi:hypothetical protein